MRKKLLLFIICINLLTSIKAQDSLSPYKMNYKVDALITVPAIAASVLSYPLRSKKDKLDSIQASAYNPGMLKGFNKKAAYKYDQEATKISDLIFNGGFGLPVLMALDPKVRKDGFAFPVMFLEAVAIAGTLDGIAGGFVTKAKPYVYNPDVPLSDKTKSKALGSFYGSHPAFTAVETFFMAKMFSDYHPHSPYRYLAYSGAAALTFASSYYRYQSGNHFITDIAVGVGIGSAIGILVPHLHKKMSAKESSGDKAKASIDLLPYCGQYNGFSLVGHF